MDSRQGTPGAVGSQTLVRDAAESLLGTRLGEVGRLLHRVSVPGLRGKAAEKGVHALRVATRRAAAAIGVLEGVVDAGDARKTLRRLKRIRKAAGEVRDLDVQASLLASAAKRFDGEAGRELRELAGRVRRSRRDAMGGLERLVEKWPRREMRERAERLIGRTVERAGSAGERRFGDAAREAVARELVRVREASGADLRDMERLHRLRLELKRLRYTMEVAGARQDKERGAAGLSMLAGVQGMLGEINDDVILLKRLREAVGERKGMGSPLRAVVAATAKSLRARHAAFVEEWKRLEKEGLFERLVGAPGSIVRVGGAGVGEWARAGAPGAFVEAKPAGLNGTLNGEASHRPGARAAGGGKTGRLAAIDVGTNSIRLIVAEAQAEGSYRILDDEREITRLGKGLGKAGKLDAGAIEHTAVTIARMKSIAQGYGVREIRVVGTSAAREAKNTRELARQIRARSGLELEVISGEEEAVLAYRSAARAFDLSATPAAVVDIGGGSTEIVLSALAGGGKGGLIERVYTIPLGAVRLTDMFGGPEACAKERYEEMRAYIKGMLKERIGRAPTTPQIVIGTGGTFTTLGAMVLQREMGQASDGLFGGAGGGVQGVEVGRADLKHLLEYLRKLPVKERTRVPGLSADRADIIVAGMAIVDGVLKRLDANRARVHEGGIRDGILLGMVGSARSDGGEGPRDPMRAVRRLAKACAYEAAHAKHVTGLALSIFDQLRAAEERVKVEPGMRFDDEARLLLEGASLLHDIGYLVNYAQHHKHSYHLIVHADLGGLTTRQVRVVANVARYHRAAEPKMRHRPFAALSDEDRALVRGLSGILRVADGLDRTHMQSVRSVGVKVERGVVGFEVGAAGEPSVDMWGAVRKCGMFEAAFGVKCQFEWKLGEARAEAGPSARLVGCEVKE